MSDIVTADFGVIDHKGVPVVSSRKVAEIFEKRHDHVLRDIGKITDPKNGLSEEFAKCNFALSKYKDSTGRKLPEYLMTRDGFTFLAMGFTGKRAARFKEAYIARFNEMERFIHSGALARLENHELNRNIQLAHDPAKHYHFSNEADLINRIVLGMSAKEFRLLYGIPKDKSIRDLMTPFQIEAIQKLQNFDAGLVATIQDFQKRKELLFQYFTKLQKSIRLPETGS